MGDNAVGPGYCIHDSSYQCVQFPGIFFMMHSLMIGSSGLSLVSSDLFFRAGGNPYHPGGALKVARGEGILPFSHLATAAGRFNDRNTWVYEFNLISGS